MATKTNKRVPVSERALVQRINRRLKHGDDEQLRKSRGEAARAAVGDYYTVKIGNGTLSRSGFDLDDFGREVGALAAYETLAS